MTACLYCLFTLLQRVSCFASVVFKRIYESCSSQTCWIAISSQLVFGACHAHYHIYRDLLYQIHFSPVHCCPNILSLAFQVNWLAHSSCSVKICFSNILRTVIASYWVLFRDGLTPSGLAVRIRECSLMALNETRTESFQAIISSVCLMHHFPDDILEYNAPFLY